MRHKTVTLFLCGDVMTGRGIDQVLPRSCPPGIDERAVGSARDYVALAERANGPVPRGADPLYVWGDALEALERAAPDARIINLETAATTCEDAAPKGINYRMHPDNTAVFAAADVDCCVLANNHVLDWGTGGLRETLEALERAGIQPAGAGPDRASAAAPAMLGMDEGRVLVFAFGAGDSGIPRSWAAEPSRPGVHRLPDFSDATVDDIARAVDAAKAPDDLAVATLHWGANWGYDIPPEHRRFAHALIDRAPIDVVHGHSSHHPKAIEVYRDRPIFYGCGDLLNDYEGISGHERFRGELALMYLPQFDAETGALVRLEMTPLRIRNFRLNRASAAECEWLRAALDRECGRFGHDVVERGEELVLEWG